MRTICVIMSSKRRNTMLTKKEQDKVYHAYQKTIGLTEKLQSYIRPEFSEFSEMYVFSTENLKGYIRKLKVKDKSVLTVTSSGDQLINLALSGATVVHNFDINKNTYYMTQLKLAALKTLRYEEFLHFFTDSESRKTKYISTVPIEKKIKENEQVFDYKVYLSIRPCLKEDCALYWDMLYEDFQFNGSYLNDSGILIGRDRKTVVTNNLYLKDEKHYEKAKEKVEEIEIKFFSLDMLKIHTLPYKYDIVILSSVYEYLIGKWYQVISEEEFKEYATKGIENILNENGIVVLAYQYHASRNQAYKLSLKQLFQKQYSFSGKENISLKEIVVPSSLQTSKNSIEEDCVYIYESGESI